MNPPERRATVSLAGVFALRMFGMFLVLPVFVLYAVELPHATPLLAGLALGMYGLTQGVLQIPFGWLSDRYGRKPVLAAGLLLFAVGSVVAATAPDIWWTLAGRALQGAGAISAVVTALLADLTRDGVRTRAMAVIGVSIGASFALSLVLGPLLGDWVGVRGIFWLTSILAVAALGVVWWVVPAEPSVTRSAPVPGALRAAFLAPGLRRLNGGIFALHFILTACFVALPQALASLPALAGVPHAYVYLPVVVGSGLLMLPLVFAGDRPALQRPLALATLTLLVFALGAMALGHGSLWPLVAALLAFFTAFNFLEASLPAAVARTAGADGRGAALGVYSSCQFLGAFAGGAAGGALYGTGGPTLVFAVSALVGAGWLAALARK
ncbi:MAG: MFS transporter [Gammaproteobacteria bacterium]